METVPVIAVLPSAEASDLPDVLPPAKLLDGLSQLISADTRRPSTKRSYESDVRAFEAFASTRGLKSPSDRPAHPIWVATWVVAMRSEGKAVATIERRVRGLGADHRIRGHADPTTHPVVVDAVRNLRRLDRRKQKQAYALRSADIHQIVRKVDSSTLAGVRDKALLLLGFAGALRVSEIAGLTVENVAISDDRIVLTIDNPKTAKRGNEVQHIVIARSQVGEQCAGVAVLDWLEVGGVKAGPLFRGLTRHGTVREQSISTRAIGDIVKGRARDAGVIGWADVSSHSLRRGWATEAASRNVPQAIIKQHGRWKTDTAAARYVDTVGSETSLAASLAVIAEVSFSEAMKRPNDHGRPSS